MTVNRNDMVTFLAGVRGQFEQFYTRFNPAGRVDKKSWDTPMGKLDAVRSSGAVFEKAASIFCDLTIETPPVLAEKIGQKGSRAEAFVLEINCYPVNPHIPRGYMELRANITDTMVFAGGTDIFPYFPVEEDAAFFADGMKELCREHGQDYEKLRKTRADFFVSKFRNEKVGSHAGIYAFHLEAKEFPFFKDIAECFFRLYGILVEKGGKRNFTADEQQRMREIHGVWVEWVLLEDAGTRYGLEKGIPPDALLGAILPPQAAF
jgi:coproporphyrinogen III oxidase